MKSNRRSIRTICILVGVCAVLAAAYFLITANEDPAAAGVLFRLGGDSIAQVKIDNQYGSFVFEQQDGAWVVESGGVYRTNPEKMTLLLSCLQEFSIDRMLPEEKSDYGFESPQAQVSVTTAGGRNYDFTVGAEAIKGVSVYIKSNGQVMLTSTGMTSQLTGSLTAYRAKDVLMVDPASIRSIEYYVDGEKTLSLSNADYQSWTMSYPFTAPARRVVMNELISRLRSLVIAGYVDSGSGETGLDHAGSKMVLTDGVGVQQTLEFGDVSGSVQYVRIGAEADVVQLYTTDLDFSELTPEGVMYIAPLNIDASQVQSISVEADGVSDTITVEHSDDDLTAYLNGGQLSDEDFTSVYYKLIALNADGCETQGPEPGECAAVCTATLTNGSKVELSLYRRDADTLYLYLNGQMLTSGQTRFYMPQSSLSELLYRLRDVGGK